MKVFIPPPSRYVRRAGTPVMALAKSTFEKLSFPAPSAGNGALWIALALEKVSKLLGR
jgi:hypothetical protein